VYGKRNAVAFGLCLTHPRHFQTFVLAVNVIEGLRINNSRE
jgi:hypothetical protein